MIMLSLAPPILYLLFVLALCAYLLVRGITQTFVGLFACGALLEIVPQIGFLVMQQAPGGFDAKASFLPLLSICGMLGTLCFAVGCALLAQDLLKTNKSEAWRRTPIER